MNERLRKAIKNFRDWTDEWEDRQELEYTFGDYIQQMFRRDCNEKWINDDNEIEELWNANWPDYINSKLEDLLCN